MNYTVRLTLSAFHKPTATWHVHAATHGLRAVSRKQALQKGLAVLTQWPGYTDRVGEADWTVDGEATLVDGGQQ